MISVGERIRQLRTEKGMTQEQLAAALNTTKAAISRYELSQRELRFSQAQAIADALDVPVFTLYGYSIPVTPLVKINQTVQAIDIAKKRIQQMREDPKYTPEDIKIAEGIQARLEQFFDEQVSAATLKEATDGNTIAQKAAKQDASQEVKTTKQGRRRFDTLSSIFYRLPDDSQNRVIELLTAYEKLTSAGQKRAVGRVKELTEMPRYLREQEQADSD